MNDIEFARKSISELMPSDYNPRTIDENALAGLRESIAQFGMVEPIVWNKRTGRIVGGHQRLRVMVDQGFEETDVVVVDLDESEEVALNITLNNPAIQGEWDDSARELLAEVGNELPDLFSAVRLDDLLSSLGGLKEKETTTDADVDGEGDCQEKNEEVEGEKNSLFDQFVVPPFTVLDQRKVYWRAHHAEWLRHGVRGCSDPVLASLTYKWFCPNGGTILDLTADDPASGLVAGLAGCCYVGLANKESVKQNDAAWKAVQDKSFLKDSMPELTPIEKVGDVWVKRDDLFCVGGVRGGKVRTCWKLASGASGLVTAGSRMSPQVNIVAHIAQRVGVPCRVHTPNGELSPEVLSAQNCGAEVVQHETGYNNVIIARAHEDAANQKWCEIPFGMECEEAVDETRAQVMNIPKDVKRIVMVVGSGMSLSGVLHGLKDNGLDIPVVGVSVGADPEERLDAYAPKEWREMVTIIKCPIDYHDEADGNILGDIILDPNYEGKCLPYLEPNDLFWIVGVRQTAVTPAAEVPVIVDDKIVKPSWVAELPKENADLLIMQLPQSVADDKWDGFFTGFEERVERGVSLLNDGRFACVVFDDLSDSDGFSRNLFCKVVRAFEKNGMKLYNEAMLVVDEPWVKNRATDFHATRKTYRAHKTFLSFFKGDLKAFKTDFGAVDLSGLEQTLVSDPGETSECVELE